MCAGGWGVGGEGRGLRGWVIIKINTLHHSVLGYFINFLQFVIYRFLYIFNNVNLVKCFVTMKKQHHHFFPGVVII